MGACILTRRGLLQSSVLLASSVLAGCLDLHHTPSGSLQIRNHHDKRHTLTVTVYKISKDVNYSPPKANESQTPTKESIWKREDTFDIRSNGSISKSRYFTEEGTYYIESKLDNGETATYWYSVYKGREGDMGGGYLYVNITSDGDILMGKAVDS